jgi:hypothetical protein
MADYMNPKFGPIPIERIEQTVAVKLANPNWGERKIAEYVGRTRGAINRELTKAARLGLLPTDPVMPGFEISRAAHSVDADGNILGSYIQQKPERGPEFEVPKGHAVKGVSAYVDGEGRTVAQWIKTKEGELSPQYVADIVKEAFDGWTPKYPTLAKPNATWAEFLTVYPVADWHMGAFAWGRETEGPDWDLSIATEAIGNAMNELIDQTPPSENALVLGLGDLVHADTFKNMTEKSGNVLDVDTRYPKVVAATRDLLVDSIERIASKHQHVTVSLKHGNHDEVTTVALRYAISGIFRGHKRITIDDSPSAFYWHRFGCCLIGGTHGHAAKMADMPLIMAARRKEDWGETTTRHCHTGHVHHKQREKEIGGVICHSHRAPVAQDAWHAAEGYLSGRSVSAFNYHREKGYRGMVEVEIR